VSYRYWRRPPRVWKAEDWPFYREGVNPVAADTPPEVEELARRFLALRHETTDEAWFARQALTSALQTHGLRNRYHRADDQLVGLFDRRSGHAQLHVTPAFGRVFREGSST